MPESLAPYLFGIAALFVAAFVYPYLGYPLVLRALPRRPFADAVRDDDAPLPSAALLMCAYNEEASLPAKIDNLRAMKAEVPELSIFAYSDCSSDATAQLLEGASDILTPVIGTTRAGKVLGMQKLIARTDAEVAVFTDANVMIDPGSLTTMLRYFRDPAVGAVATTLVYEEEDDDGSVTAKVGGAYWRLEEHIKQLESASGSMMGADGAFFARRRAGYPAIPSELVDDMAVSLGVLFDDMRCVSAPDVIGRERSVANRDEEFRRKRRIACGSYSTYRYLKPQMRAMSFLDRFKFFSHKIMRWWGAAYLLIAAVAIVAGLALTDAGAWAIPALAVGAAVFVLLGRQNVKGIGALYEILLAVLATGLGVLESFRGKRYQTWEPAKTR